MRTNPADKLWQDAVTEKRDKTLAEKSAEAKERNRARLREAELVKKVAELKKKAKTRKTESLIESVTSRVPGTEGEVEFASQVVGRFQAVCELWAAGKSMQAIAHKLHLENGPALRKAISADRTLRQVLSEYTELRADAMYEQAIDWGYTAASLGPLSPQGLKIGIDAAFKVAAQLAPDKYGEFKRTETRDRTGRLMATETTTGTSATPAEAYERMLKQQS